METTHEKIDRQQRQIQALQQRVTELEDVVELAIEWAKLDHPGGSFLEKKLRDALKQGGIGHD